MGVSHVIEMCRQAEEAVDKLCQEDGAYEAIEFKHVYAKPATVQYMVSIALSTCSAPV